MPLLTQNPLPRRRGSVLILVVAVLVLLALMGTAYIATSRSDRIASASSETTASVDTLARGVVDTLQTQLANDRLDSSNSAVGAVLRNTATAYFSYNSALSASRTEGLMSLAARVPVAPASGDRPRWPFISAPLSASPTDPGFFTNPAPNAPFTTASWTPTAGTTLNSNRWGQNEFERRGSAANVIGSVTLTADGRIYPAFLTTTAAGSGYALAADADGDGIADAGLVSLGTLSNPDFAGITFFYGLRVIDNNSALNANTAWTTGSDFTTVGTTAPLERRNNRLFPAAIGLKESTTPIGFGQITKLDSFDSDPNGFDLSAYRAGRLGLTNAGPNPANPLLDHAIPSVDVGTSGRTDLPARRTDFQFNTAQELLFFQLARRLDFPGTHSLSSSTDPFYRFTPFTLAEQAELAYGFVLAPRDIADNTNFAAAIDKRTPLEQLLPASLYRVSGSPVANTFGSSPNFLQIRTAPYATSNIGFRRDTPDRPDWFNENFNYETVPASTPDPLTILNLRPLLVAQNPVAQSTTFKPLPLFAVIPPTATPAYDKMNPYVPEWNATSQYVPGDVVYYWNSTTTPNGRFYRNAFSGRTTAGNLPHNHLATATPTADRPWVIYNGPLVPTKVDVNTAPFGDLWRAFYSVFTSDNIDPNDISGPNSSNGTVSHFGVPKLANGTTDDVLSGPLEELYRGMGFASGTATSTLARPIATGPDQATYHPQRALRSNVKDFSTLTGPTGHFSLPPAEMAKLRAAQAAVNAEYLRTANQSFSGSVPDNVVRRKISLNSSRNTSATSPDVAATVYSIARFPYITEVYTNNDGISLDTNGNIANPSGYVAVELYNPYPFDINLSGWRLSLLQRGPATATAIPAAGRTVNKLIDFTSTAVIPAYGFLVLENYTTDTATTPDLAGVANPSITASPATRRPTGSGLAATGSVPRVFANAGDPPSLNFAHVPNLGAIFSPTYKGELILTRPSAAAITGSTQTATANTSDETDYVPVDSVDLTAVNAVVADITSPVDNFHYMRRTDNWRFVYPGRYDGNNPFRQHGLLAVTWNVVDAASGFDNEPPMGAVTMGNSSATATYNTTFPIQIANIGHGGLRAFIDSTTTSNDNSFPFGGLMRELDILQIPFISPVRLAATSAAITDEEVFDLISLTQDAAFAEDTDTNDNFEENVGRFAPIAIPRPTGGSALAVFTDINEFTADTAFHRYGFANRLLDHLTVRSSSRLNAPGVAPTPTNGGTFSVANYPEIGAAAVPAVPVAPQASAFAAPNAVQSYDAGVQGLININTAPLPVLAAVPWVRTGTTATAITDDRADNVLIAKAIIAHREANGPFRSLFELNMVRGFRTFNDADNTTTLTGLNVTSRGTEQTDPTTNSAFTDAAHRSNDNGDFSPPASGSFPGNMNGTPGSDSNFPGTLGSTAIATDLANPIGDYESQFLNLTAVSNLLTTRSDTFTAYIVIEGWRNAGTSSATRVLQRRYAYILDRSAVAPGVPPELLNLTSAAIQTNPDRQPVVEPAGLSRPLNTSIRVTEIPVPQNP